MMMTLAQLSSSQIARPPRLFRPRRKRSARYYRATTTEAKSSSNNDNDDGEKKNQQQQRQQQQTQENCYQCRVVGTSACAVAASVVAYDRILGPKRPLAHSVLYGAFGLGFAGLGALR